MSIESLNTDCHCISLDAEALHRALQADPATADLDQLIAERSPHLFAALPVFVSREHVERMAQVVSAVTSVARMPAYREAVLAWAPAIARHDPGTPGVFMSYDFHLGSEGPKLIEINTNAGGALLNAYLGRAQQACCREVEVLVSGPVPAAALDERFLEMFLAEWRAAGRSGQPRRLAIVDEAPQGQFLYAEFRLFARLFERHGIEPVIVAPEDLRFESGELRDAAGRIDFVYNRLTDFALAAASSRALREAYLAGAAVISPHPRAHALFADKRNLALLSEAAELARMGVDAATTQVLLEGIAATRRVRPAEAEALWAERRRLFFKPAAGYGSKAAYRGDKLTRRVWEEILAGEYVAQALVVPSERQLSPTQTLKVDLRNYAYDGAVLSLAARLYQGQTTNFRTAGGGFAPVLTPPADGAGTEAPACHCEPASRAGAA